MTLPVNDDTTLNTLLEKRFGFTSFRPHQREVCQQLVLGRDILLVMPTGAGKSLCYQLPGLARGGTTIVITPLLALIEDQVAKLKANSIRAERIHSGRMRMESRSVCIQYLAGQIDFLFIAPERLSVPGFVELLKRRPPSLIAIDEAHCISQWGHDFRPDYRLLGERLQNLRPAPILALTATATPLVQDDISKQLGLVNHLKLIFGFRRDNISIQLIEMTPKNRVTMIRTVLKKKNSQPAIVYAPTRKMADHIALELSKDFSTGVYHAGLLPEEREQNQTLFQEGKLNIIVATVAFGMGIDKANIRTIIHSGMPSSVEGYYQEIGRAGRDGLQSQAVLLHSYGDQRTHDYFFERDYPDIKILNRIFRELDQDSLPKDTLRLKFRDLDDVQFEKALEKLSTHKGAVIDFEGKVTLGTEAWRKTYPAQRAHKQKQSLQMRRYVYSYGCRMLELVRHFGDLKDSGLKCGMCDSCAPERFATPKLMTTKLRKKSPKNEEVYPK